MYKSGYYDLGYRGETGGIKDQLFNQIRLVYILVDILVY